MIRILNLQFSYPNSAFRLAIDDLTIQKGESVVVIGPSGTGKTTLLNLIAGVITPQSGKVFTNNVALSALSDEQRRAFRIRNIGLVFQEFELLEYLNVYDNIVLPYRMCSGLTLGKGVYERVEKLVELTGIADKLKRPIRYLSQGERQRVAFCRASLTDPPLVLADEPTGNLDPENTERLLNILFEHVRAVGATLVTVTHERSYLDRFDRILDFSDFRKVNAHA